MTGYKRFGIVCLAGMGLLWAGHATQEQSIISIPSFISSAEAKVGRPLTPVSVAGVARRTTRRCAAGVYNC